MDELPSLSQLRQKVAGCYEVFGMCPEGEVVALDTQGRVNCLKANTNSGVHLCEEDGSPCGLEAKPSNILDVIHLLRNFLVENFIAKEGIVAKKDEPKEQGRDTVPQARMPAEASEKDYTYEDIGVSRHLSEMEKLKRRQALKKEQTTSGSDPE